MSEHMSPIPSRLYNAAVGGHVAGADQIIDDETGLTLDKVTGGALEEKTYTSGSDNGMGRVVLRKNLVEGVNTLVQTMINKSNTIYVIQYDFTLGEDITVPANCLIEFDGGSLSGGTITGTNTGINSGLVKIFNTNITLAGSWNVVEAYPEWFGAKGDGVTDDVLTIQKCLSSFNNACLGYKRYAISKPIIVRSYQSIVGKGKNSSYIIKNNNTPSDFVFDTKHHLNINVDAAIIIISKDNDASGEGLFRDVVFRNFAIHGSNCDYGIYFADGRAATTEYIRVFSCKKGYTLEYCWGCTFKHCDYTYTYSSNYSDINNACVGFQANTLPTSGGYTSITLERCSVDKSYIGYDIRNTSYFTFINCSCDHAVKNSYKLYNCNSFDLISPGTEFAYMTTDADSAVFNFDTSIGIVHSAYLADNGVNTDAEASKVAVLIKNNSEVNIVNLVKNGTNKTNTIKCTGYSSCFLFAKRLISDYLTLDVDSGSTLISIDGDGLKNIYNGYTYTIPFSSIVTLENYATRLGVATASNNGLLPAGYVFEGNSSVKDANSLRKGFYLTTGAWTNLPFNSWGGLLTAISVGDWCYQLAFNLSTYLFYYRVSTSNGWTSWMLVGRKWQESDGSEIASVGTTSNRPILTNSQKGFSYFDTSLANGNGKPIWWNGSAWVDATGTPV